jgi:hypothetical protein
MAGKRLLSDRLFVSFDLRPLGRHVWWISSLCRGNGLAYDMEFDRWALDQPTYAQLLPSLSGSGTSCIPPLERHVTG